MLNDLWYISEHLPVCIQNKFYFRVFVATMLDLNWTGVDLTATAIPQLGNDICSTSVGCGIGCILFSKDTQIVGTYQFLYLSNSTI